MTSRRGYTAMSEQRSSVNSDANIQAITDLLSQATGSAFDSSAVASQLRDPTKAEDVRKILVSKFGTSIPDSATFYTSLNPKQKSIITPKVPSVVNEEPGFVEKYLDAPSQTVFPSMDQKPTLKGKAYALARDVATLPLRTVAGIGAGLGDFGRTIREGSEQDPTAVKLPYSNMDPRLLQYVPEAAITGLETMQRTMRSPSRVAEETESPTIFPKIAAGMAEDPLTIPAMKYGIGKNLISTMVRGIPVGLATYATHAADRASAGRDDVFRGETLPEYISDVAPVLAPPALNLIGKGIVAPLAKATEFLGSGGKEKALDLAMSQFKAAPKVKGGQEWEGLKEALMSKYNNKPLITQLFTGNESDIPAVVKNYQTLKSEVDKNFTPILEAMKDAGVKVDQKKILDRVYKDIDEYFVGEKTAPTWSAKKIQAAKDFVSSAINRHFGDAQMQDFATKMANNELLPDVYVTRGGKNVIPSLRKLDSRMFEAQARLGRIDPNMYEPLYRTPQGNLVPRAGAFQYDPLNPATAHKAKSSMWEEAFKRSPEQETEKEYAALAAGKALRDFMTNPELSKPMALVRAEAGEKSGLVGSEELVKALRRKYNTQVPLYESWKQQLEKSQPFYAAEPAMIRAEHTTANRYPSIKHALSNPILYMQERPNTVNTLYELGADTEFLEKLLKGAGKVPGTKMLQKLMAESIKPSSGLVPSSKAVSASFGKFMTRDATKSDTTKTKK